MNSKTYCLEYSDIQKAYHISTKEEMLAFQLHCKARNINNGYVCLSEHESYEEARDAMYRDMQERKAVVKQNTELI
jgi:hypothetical protein